MVKKLRGALWVTVALLCAPIAPAQDTVESIEKAVTDAWNRLNSMSATLAANAEFKLKPENPAPMKAMGGGTVNYLKKGETPLYALEGWAGLSEQAKLAQARCVHDGQQLHVDTLVFGKVESETPANAITPGGKALFDFLRENLNLAAKPAEKLNDKEAYVIEGALKQPDEKIPMASILIYFDKATGIPLKVASLDKQGMPSATITVNDIKVNPPLAEDLFKYVPLAPPAPPALPTPPAAPAAAAPAAPAAPSK
jgi:outer membrane lipoprotein-sorting protein